MEEVTHKYFTAFKKIGVNTELQLFRLRENEIIEKASYDHADFDGISAIVDLAKKVSGEEFTSPTVRFTSEPKAFEKFKQLLKWYLKFWPFKPSLWKSHGKKKRVSAWKKFRLPKDITSNELNTRLLLSLDRASLNYLRNPKQKRMWMIPVSLYEKIDHTINGGNRISFIDVRIDESTTGMSLQNQIRQSLKEKNYWGTILTIKPVALVGVTLFALFLKTAHLSFRRTGTLTNMGEWKIPNLPQDEWWVFGDGMVALMNPVVGTVMLLNGHLGISAIFHESLGMTEDMAQKFLNEWEIQFERL